MNEKYIEMLVKNTFKKKHIWGVYRIAVATAANLHLWKSKIQIRKNDEIPALFLCWLDCIWNMVGIY